MNRILLVEDDKIMNRMIRDILSADGYSVAAAYTAKEAVAAVADSTFALTILDVNLPDGSGFDLCQRIAERGRAGAVIFLTANDLEQDMVKGYELGAVDYITKPFSGPVLRHKVKALLGLLAHDDSAARHIYDDGHLRIDFSGLQAQVNGIPVDLAPLEFRILEVFVHNKGILLTRRKLFENLWDADANFVEEHTLTAAVSRIRKKIECAGRQYIKTVYGMGYLFTGGEESQ